MRFFFFFSLMALHLTGLSQDLLFAAKESGKKFGYVNSKGEYVIAPAFDDASAFFSGIAVVKSGKKFGIINSRGQYLVQPQYDDALFYFPEGKVTVKSKGKWGVINSRGDVVLPFKFSYASVFNEGVTIVGVPVKTPKEYRDRLKFYVADSLGNIDGYEGEETAALSFNEGDKFLLLPGRMIKGYYDQPGWPIVRDGKVILDDGTGLVVYDVNARVDYKLYEYDPGSFAGFQEGLLACTDNNEGEPTGASIYLRAENDGYSGFSKAFSVNANEAYPFFNGVAAVDLDGKWGFIDSEGWIISRTNLSTSDYSAGPPMFFNGLIGFFNKESKVGYVNLKGETIIPFLYEEYHPFETDVTPVKYNGRFGLLKKDGTWAVEPRFEELQRGPCPCFR